MNQTLKNLRKSLGALLCLSILSGALPQTRGQQNETSTGSRIGVPQATDIEQSFGRMLKFSRGAEFGTIVERELGADKAQAALAWFDAKDKILFKAVFAAHRSRANSFAEQRLQPEQTTKPNLKPASAAPKSRGKKRASLNQLSGGNFMQTASFSKIDDESGGTNNVANEDEKPQVTTVETADGVKTVGEVVNKIETAETIITKSSNAETGRIVNDRQNGATYTQTSFEDVFNKQTRGRVRNDKKLQWNFLLAQCPDADGLVEGEATVVIENKTTIADTQTIAVPTQTLTMKVKLKGYVNDEAELTHYDLTGDIAEKTTGYDRAKQLGFIDETAFADGARQFSISVTGNKIVGTHAEKTGVIKEGETWHLTTEENNRLIEFVDTALPLNLINAENGFSASQTNWRNGFCVGVALVAPKKRLASGEETSVSAETVHKLDNSKINARLEASGFEIVTPDTQNAAPAADFGLTASTNGQGAEITVKSISRRGIGAKTLAFGAEKTIGTLPPTKKPVPPTKKTPAKNCGWSGKINAVKRKITKVVKPADGRLVRAIENSEEVFSIDYHVTGIQDTTGGFVNGWFADAQMNYRAAEYRENNYAAGKMSCDKQIITSPQTIKFESLMTALSSKRITVYVSLGDKGILTFGSPEVNAERTITRTYETNCPSYNRVNSGVDRSDNLIGVPNPGFEIHFELDKNSRSYLVGSKTIQESDDTEIIVTWNLTRDCK